MILNKMHIKEKGKYHRQSRKKRKKTIYVFLRRLRERRLLTLCRLSGGAECFGVVAGAGVVVGVAGAGAGAAADLAGVVGVAG